MLYQLSYDPKLQSHLFPLTFPVRVPYALHTLMTKEVLAVNAWLRHGGCTVLEESDNIDSLRDDLAVDDKVNLGVNLMVGLPTVGVPLSKLCSVSSLAVDPDLSVPCECSKMKDVTVSKGLIASVVVNWT